MFNKELAAALKGLTTELSRWREFGFAHLATKTDVFASEERIIKAFGERADPAKMEELYNRIVAGKDKVQAAISTNQVAPPKVPIGAVKK